MRAVLRAIEYYLPEDVLTNQRLADESPQFNAEKIERKTGIAERRIATDEECSSDLAVAAATRLFDSGAANPGDIDYLLLCTQSPDYFLPTTACLLQDRLGIPVTAGAIDFNLGCSGFVYGLGLAKGLIETGQASGVLLLTAETYSKFIHPQDMSVRTLFGDAAAATLVCGEADTEHDAPPAIGPFVYGTDGRGAKNLIVAKGGMRGLTPDADELEAKRLAPSGAGPAHLYMNGPEIFTFTLKTVPRSVAAMLDRGNLALADVDLFVFHQANEFMLKHLREKIDIPEEKFYISMRDCGNTVSSTIPIALHHAAADGTLRTGDRVMLVGFGVGYSWAATLIRWQG